MPYNELTGLGPLMARIFLIGGIVVLIGLLGVAFLSGVAVDRIF